MSEDVTEKIRTLLVQLMQKKSISTSQMAQQIGMDRKKLKRILGGREVMSVDILLQISEKLELKPEDLSGIEEISTPNSNTNHQSQRNQGLPKIASSRSKEKLWEHNQARALIEIGFEQALYFTFLAHTDQLKDSGLPDYILQKFARHVPIQLDPLYHVHNKPDFQKKGLLLTLSFDALYTCFFPWKSIVQVVFQPMLATIDQDSVAEDEQDNGEMVSPSQDKDTCEETIAESQKSIEVNSAKKAASPFAVISNDAFEEEIQEEERVDPVSKKPIFTLVEDDDI